MSDELFRREVLDARKAESLGRVHLSTTPMAWPAAIVAAAAVLALVAILAFGSYTPKATVHGQLVPAGGLLDVVSGSAGRVSHRFVEEGEAVAADQPLFEISPDVEPAGDGGAVGARVAEALERERAALHEELAALEPARAEEEAALRREIAAQQRRLASTTAELELRERQAASAAGTLDRIRPLLDEKIISDVQLQQYENEALNARAQRESVARERLDAGTALADARRRLASLPREIASRRNALGTALSEVEQSIARNEAARGTLWRAPAAGTVSGLAREAGQSVAAGQRLASIAPAGAPLQAELWAPSQAVGGLRVGDRVAMRYDSFPHAVFGQPGGRIAGIAESPLGVDEQRARGFPQATAPAYRILVVLDSQRIDDGRGPRALRAGMSLEADLLLERRRLHRFLFAPRRATPAAANVDGDGR
ncbi:HlyD family secretion protein [Luteimonas sp. BDR2-5]|uniref:HlyD family secretion protein n=1 Tax=Proluteimonas luteida TaxID=2878685 RepID=UPI001E500CE7|nr:HlyD family efflux transporter periplasmic adaptor subunit [Luteimonas sp. BDR2-5]MCD9027611.1 HlyD family secretion protein [Luteimonas sp. BDR2-5]